MRRPLQVAWFSFFPMEWLASAPAEVRAVPRQHPATWQRVLLEQFQREPGLELHLFSLRPDYPRDQEWREGNACFHAVRTGRGMRAPTAFWTDTRLLRSRLERIGPDLVHAWGTESGAALVASRMPWPHVVTMQGIFSYLRTRVSLHPYARLMVWFERWALARLKVLTVESAFGARWIGSRHPRLQIHRIQHAPHPRFFQLVRDPRIDPPRLLFVGAWTEAKGGPLLAEALRRIDPALRPELRVVGGISARDAKRLREELGPRFQPAGMLPPEQLAEEYARATLLVYPSLAENSPNVVKEALAAGLPVLASDAGGIPELVEPGRTGLLFQSGDPEDLAGRLEEAMRHPLFASGGVEEAAWKSARAALDPESMARSFKSLYRRIHESEKAGPAPS